MNANSWTAIVVLMLGLASCQSGLGRVPVDIVKLYDMAAPGGGMEIELNRDGSIVEVEADVDPSTLPTAVRNAALEKAPGGMITGAEREVTSSGWMWEVKLNHQGRAWEFILDDAGNVLESEKELQRGEAPAAVLKAADEAITGGTFKSVELIVRGEEQEYHVKKMRDGASYKIVLAPNGEVRRKVREAVCEIEIPLK